VAKQEGDWHDRDQGVVVLRRKSDDDVAVAIVDGIENGWTLVSHNVVQVPQTVWFILFFGIMSSRTVHVLTFTKSPS
jgi:hypothetical protein